MNSQRKKYQTTLYISKDMTNENDHQVKVIVYFLLNTKCTKKFRCLLYIHQLFLSIDYIYIEYCDYQMISHYDLTNNCIYTEYCDYQMMSQMHKLYSGVFTIITSCFYRWILNQQIVIIIQNIETIRLLYNTFLNQIITCYKF